MNAWTFTWYVLSFPAWLILGITAAARLADIGRDQWAIRDHVRRVGLIGVGMVSLVELFAPYTAGWWHYAGATWESALVAWSWTFVWLTTPGMPPWWDFILGVHRNTDAWRDMGLRARIRGELRALRDSFRLRRKADRWAPPAGRS